MSVSPTRHTVPFARCRRGTRQQGGRRFGNSRAISAIRWQGKRDFRRLSPRLADPISERRCEDSPHRMWRRRTC